MLSFKKKKKLHSMPQKLCSVPNHSVKKDKNS